MQEFLTPEYFQAVAAAVGNGLGVFLGFVVITTLIVYLAGGPAARKWGEAP